MDRFNQILGLSLGPRLVLLLVAIGCLPRERWQARCLAAGSASPSVGTLPSGPLLLPRTTIRVELKPGEERMVALPVVNPTANVLRILSLESPCRCIRLGDHPRVLPPGARAELSILVSGTMPGSKTVEIATDGGRQPVTFQVVVDGQGLGRDAAARAAKQLAAGDNLHGLVLLHDLQGQVRGCGCSGAAFGGLEKLPALCAEFPAGRTTWWASGDIFGGTSARRIGNPPYGPSVVPVSAKTADRVAAILARLSIRQVDHEQSLQVEGGKVLSAVVTNQPQEALAGHDLVITTAPQRPLNAKVLVPQFKAGMGVDLFLLDGRGFPVGHYLIPLDESVQRDAALAQAVAAAADRQRFAVAESRDWQRSPSAMSRPARPGARVPTPAPSSAWPSRTARRPASSAIRPSMTAVSACDRCSARPVTSRRVLTSATRGDARCSATAWNATTAGTIPTSIPSGPGGNPAVVPSAPRHPWLKRRADPKSPPLPPARAIVSKLG